MKINRLLLILALSVIGIGSVRAFDACIICRNPYKPFEKQRPKKEKKKKDCDATNEFKCDDEEEENKEAPVCGGDPVNLEDGSLDLQRRDLQVDGIIAIQMELAYQSVGNAVGRFGFGWHFNYDMRVNRDVDGNYFLRIEGGQLRKYSPSGVQLDGEPSSEIFKVNANGTYTLQRSSRIYEFNAWGILSYIFDRSGNSLHFIYETDEAGNPLKSPIYGVSRYMPQTGYFEIAAYDYKLLRIENTQNPSLQFVAFFYNNFGWVENATDHAGRSFTYTYNPDVGTLLRATNPVGEFIYYVFNPADPLEMTSFINQARCNQDADELVTTNSQDGHTYSQSYRGKTVSFGVNKSAVTAPTTVNGVQAIRNGEVSYSASTENFGDGYTLMTTMEDTAYTYVPAVLPPETHRRVTELYPEKRFDGTMNTRTRTRFEILNEAGQITYQMGWDGSSATYTYDGRMRLTEELTNVKNPVTGGVGHYFMRQKFDGDNREPARMSEGEVNGDSSVTLYEYDPVTGQTRFEKRLVVSNDPSTALVTEDRYDSKGLLVEEVDPLGRSTRYEHDALGNRTAQIDAENDRLEWEYDVLGRMVLERDAEGGEKTYEYDAMGKVTKECDETQVCKRYTYLNSKKIKIEEGIVGGAPGIVTRYEYDTQGRLSRMIREMGAGVDFEMGSFQYDAHDKVIRESGQQGLKWTYVSDAFGRAAERSDSLGHTWKMLYDVNGNDSLALDPLGFMTLYVKDSRGLLVKTVDAENMSLPEADRKATLWEYDFAGRVKKVTDALGGIVAKDYDGLGRVVREIGPVQDATRYTYQGHLQRSVQTPEGKLTFYEYDRADRLVKQIRKEGDVNPAADASDEVEEYRYDKNGREIKVILGGKVQSTTEYSARGEIKGQGNGADEFIRYTFFPTGEKATETYPWGHVDRFDYDALGRLTRSYDALGDKLLVAFSSDSRIVTSSVPGAGSKVETFNALGELLQDSDPAQGTTDYTLDERHLLSQLRDGLGNTIAYTRDALGRVTRKVDERGFSTYSSFDPIGRIKEIRDNENNATTYSYELLPGGTRMTRTQPDGKTDVLETNRDNEAVLVKDGKSQRTLLQYDGLGYLKEKEYQDGTKADFQYDAQGRLKSGVYGGVRSDFSYDKAGRVILNHQTVQGEIFDVGYAYNLSANTRRITYPDGFQVQESFDGRERGISTTTSTGASITSAYANNILTGMSRGNGVSTAFSHEPTGRLSRIRHFNSSGDIQDFEYGYDAMGMEVSRLFRHDPGSSRVVGYTTDHQLNDFRQGTMDGSGAIPSPAIQKTWNLDSRGNWTSLVENGVTETRQHNSTNQATRVGTSTATYDENGNLTSFQGLNLSWNPANLLVSAGGATYGYNAFGQRVMKTLPGGSTIKFAYEGDRVAYSKRSDGMGTRYVFGTRFIDEFLFASRTDGVSYYPLEDRDYSVTATTNINGDLVEEADYDPYGGYQLKDAQSTPIAASQVGNEIWFMGRTQDSETGLYYFRARYLDPRLGRFISRDPTGFDGGDINLYRAFHNDPINLWDPQGLDDRRGGPLDIDREAGQPNFIEGENFGWFTDIKGRESRELGKTLARIKYRAKKFTAVKLGKCDKNCDRYKWTYDGPMTVEVDRPIWVYWHKIGEPYYHYKPDWEYYKATRKVRMVADKSETPYLIKDQEEYDRVGKHEEGHKLLYMLVDKKKIRVSGSSRPFCNDKRHVNAKAAAQELGRYLAAQAGWSVNHLQDGYEPFDHKEDPDHPPYQGFHNRNGPNLWGSEDDKSGEQGWESPEASRRSFDEWLNAHQVSWEQTWLRQIEGQKAKAAAK